MKRTLLLMAALMAGMLQPHVAYAQAPSVLTFPGSDDFNANVRDPARWGTSSDDYTFGGGVSLVDRLGRLYVSGSSVGGDRFRPWSLGHAPHAADWTAKVDVHVPMFTWQAEEALFLLTNGVGTRSVGITVLNADDDRDFAGITLSTGHFSPDPLTLSSFRSYSFDGSTDGNEGASGFEPAILTSASLRLRWEAIPKVLYMEYSTNSTRDIWIPVVSKKLNWQMNSGSRFVVAVGASLDNLGCSLADEVYLDNFQASFPTTLPHVSPLTAAQPVVAGGNVTLGAASTSMTSGQTFQWRKNGTAIPGATAATLPLASLSRANSGSYDVMVRNADGGSIAGSPAQLRVLVPQAIGHPERLAGGGFKLRFGDQDGGSIPEANKGDFLVQWSTNFTNWFNLTNMTRSILNGKVELEDAGTAGQARRFYRVLER